jgi:hypothetical protein
MARLLVGTALVSLAMVAPAGAQSAPNCTMCHTVSAGLLPPIHQTAEWAASGHAASTVGCQSCHGGNPTATRATDAHRGVLRSASPVSTVNEVNLPSTCVSCHRATSVAVSGTIHQILAEAGDGRTPTCVTCHGLAVSSKPAPADMERQCAACHRPGSARAAYPAVARDLLDAIASLRTTAAATETELSVTTNPGRRTELATLLLSTQATIREASAAFHQFRPTTLAATLAAIKPKLADNADVRVANPPSGRQ